MEGAPKKIHSFKKFDTVADWYDPNDDIVFSYERNYIKIEDRNSKMVIKKELLPKCVQILQKMTEETIRS